MDNQVLKALETLISAGTYTDFQVVTADVPDNPEGFFMEVPAGGGVVIGKTFRGNAFSATFGEGFKPIKLRSLTFAGAVAGIKIYFK